jgi:hypothetical protein
MEFPLVLIAAMAAGMAYLLFHAGYHPRKGEDHE